MSKRRSAQELADELAGIGQEICRRAGEEVRADVALEIEDRFLGKHGLTRAGGNPADHILEELEDNPVMQTEELRAARERFDEEGIPKDFRLGITFVVKLLTDPKFDY